MFLIKATQSISLQYLNSRGQKYFSQNWNCTSPVIFQKTLFLDKRFEKVGGFESEFLDKK